MGALLVPVLALAGFAVMGVSDAVRWVGRGWGWLVEWPARRRVRLALAREMAAHVGELVPEQRPSPECVVIPFQRKAR